MFYWAWVTVLCMAPFLLSSSDLWIRWNSTKNEYLAFLCVICWIIGLLQNIFVRIDPVFGGLNRSRRMCILPFYCHTLWVKAMQDVSDMNMDLHFLHKNRYIVQKYFAHPDRVFAFLRIRGGSGCNLCNIKFGFVNSLLYQYDIDKLNLLLHHSTSAMVGYVSCEHDYIWSRFSFFFVTTEG